MGLVDSGGLGKCFELPSSSPTGCDTPRPKALNPYDRIHTGRRVKETNEFRQLFRVVSPVVVAGLLLAGGLLVLSDLAIRGDRILVFWFWPLTGVIFFVLAWAFRERLAEWVSPQVFLMASVPVLVLLLSAQVLLPYVQSPWASPDEPLGEKVDVSGELMTVDGKRVSIGDYPGKLVFLNFWATWCGPCRAEMPAMAELYTELRGEGLAMLAITDEDPETIRRYLEDNPYPFPIVIDRDSRLFRRLRVFALPTTIILDDQSRIVLEHQGAYQWDTPQMLDRFRRLLAE